MTDYIYLQGSEQVERAAYTMREAASQMDRAVNSMDYTLQAFLTRFEDAVARLEALRSNLEK